MQVDFTGLVRRAHCSSRDRVQQCTPKVSLALTNRIIRAMVMSFSAELFKIEIASAVRLSLRGHSCWTPSCCAKKVLKHVKPYMRQAGVMNYQHVNGWANSRTGVAIAN